MILALVLAAALAPPSPQPSPLKEIVRVRSSSFCTAVRENLAVAVLALRNNDAIIARGGDTFAKMGHDSAVDARIAMSLDEVRLENVEDAIVHNLALMDRLIQDSGRFPASPKTADDALLKDLQRETNAVADRQRKSLNVISLTLDAQQRMELQDQDDSMGAGTLVTPSKSLPPFGDINRGTSALADPRSQFLTNAGLGKPIIGESEYDGVIRQIATNQAGTASAEKALGDSITAAVSECK